MENLAIMRQVGIEQITASNRASFEKLKKKMGITYFLHMGFTDESVSGIWSRVVQELGRRAHDELPEMLAQAVATIYFGLEEHPLSSSLMEYLKKLLRE